MLSNTGLLGNEMSTWQFTGAAGLSFLHPIAIEEIRINTSAFFISQRSDLPGDFHIVQLY